MSKNLMTLLHLFRTMKESGYYGIQYVEIEIYEKSTDGSLSYKGGLSPEEVASRAAAAATAATAAAEEHTFETIVQKAAC